MRGCVLTGESEICLDRDGVVGLAVLVIVDESLSVEGC